MRYLLMLVIVLFSTHSLAGFRAQSPFTSPAGSCYDSQSAACAAVTGPGSYTYQWNSNNNACYRFEAGLYIGSVNIATCDAACPAGRVRTNGICGCPSGYDEFNGTCVPPCPSGKSRDGSGVCVTPCASGTHDAAVFGNAQNCVPNEACGSKAGQRYGSNSSPESGSGWYRCNAGCAATCAISITSGNSGSVTLVNSNLLSCEYTGATCTTAPGDTSGQANSPPPNTDPKAQTGEEGNGCGPGSVYGSVSGVSGCYASSNSPGGINFGGVGSPGNGGTPSTGGGSGGGDGGGDGAGSGVTPGTGGGGGGDGGENGSSELPDHTDSDAANFSEAVENFKDGLQGTPIVNAITSMGDMFSASSGTCPTPGFTIFGQSFQIDMHCVLYANISGTLAALMMVIWTFVGLRIIASA